MRYLLEPYVLNLNHLNLQPKPLGILCFKSRGLLGPRLPLPLKLSLIQNLAQKVCFKSGGLFNQEHGLRAL